MKRENFRLYCLEEKLPDGTIHSEYIVCGAECEHIANLHAIDYRKTFPNLRFEVRAVKPLAD